ncbi:DUF1540 domain-containing protein [Metabacillus halosaccharovorans]|uniref:DUF1540 domain-containing protein n=1 Tax=Metabacillus halosaccharovorans TaxID=930124 RepID=A0ABT3DHR4_9BACI|nr:MULTISPECIES: DUF1540 domain-containing protein [Metabacillus]MCM3441641.1 DUF1540 domain-containing protein [Metabacillus halosaccharovorans]MCV9886449.1 DUF1540 domain-containing protein [Metabacillus halosaccharovorans]
MAQDVLCEVSSCVHNINNENKCGATQIYVVNHKEKNASTSSDTDCKTFEPSDM